MFHTRRTQVQRLLLKIRGRITQRPKKDVIISSWPVKITIMYLERVVPGNESVTEEMSEYGCLTSSWSVLGYLTALVRRQETPSH